MSLFTNAYRFLPKFKGKKRLGKVLFGNELYKNIGSPIHCKRGLSYYIVNTFDSVGRDLFFDGIYEADTVRKIEKALVDGDVMLDAGANIGAISLPVAKNKNVRIIAFEPARHVFEALQKNVALNNINNIEAFPLALSNECGYFDFYESDTVHGWSGLIKINGFDQYKVPAVTLDDFAKENNIGSIAVLKIDVQGWEYFVLQGAAELIKQKKIKHIFFEFEWWAEQNAGLQPGSAQEFLLKNGYSLYNLNGIPLNDILRTGTAIIHAST